MLKKTIIAAAILATGCAGPGLVAPDAPTYHYQALAVDTEKGNHCSARGILGEVIPVTVIVAGDTLYWDEPVATAPTLDLDVLPFSGPVTRVGEGEILGSFTCGATYGWWTVRSNGSTGTKD